MLRINEESKWEDEVPLLTRADKVEGGILGASNQQAIILANRTRKLKDDFDSAIDYREYTFYITPDDPDGTIAGIAA
ncbi:TPA: spore coat protein CotH, partial [Klebsiella pneumoniae]|nr:spore coat protein CotH [Klebsiella pneumoniae]